jgi:hypothetical protein
VNDIISVVLDNYFAEDREVRRVARATLNDMLEEGCAASIAVIIHLPRGSWKWQDAYRVAVYAARRTKKGKWIWVNDGYRTGKASMPQLKKCGYGSLHVGSLHNSPIA